MAQLNKEAIQHLTKLCRIACTDEEQDNLLRDLQKILAYIEQLNSVNTDNVQPCNSVLENMSNVTRDDIVGDILPRPLFLENVPSHTGGLVKVPLVIKNG